VLPERKVNAMAGLQVTYADIESTVARLKSGQESLVQTLNQLKSDVDSLVGAGFVTDQASGAFQTSYEQFTTGATNAVNGLEGMYGFLTSAQNAMSDLDQQLANSLK